MAMKSTVVIVAVSLTVAIVLAATLVLAIERRGQMSFWPIGDSAAAQVRLADPAASKLQKFD